MDPPAPVVWDENGLPRSRLFGDVYFSSADGLAESRAVFLQGCGLPRAWRGRARFCVGELGFGSGLNVLALLDLWAREREPGAALHIFSIEAFPMAADEARRILGAWPELADLAARLTDAWPRRAPGFHRLAFDDLGATLDLAVMDVAQGLYAWSGQADAWFLDGFSPAANPGMWSPAVLAGIAAHSAPGARAATFTVAGAVRRGLSAAGFQVEKRPGFGRKRERLEATAPGAPATRSLPPRVAVVGGGIAGASLSHAFAALGVRPLVVEAERPGAGASGNPAALVMPRLDAGGGEVARLFAQAFARAVDLYDAVPHAVISQGVVQLESGPKDPGRFDRIAESGLFAIGTACRLSPEQTAEILDEPAVSGGLAFAQGRVVEPATVIDRWLAEAEIGLAAVARIEPAGEAWRLIDGEGGLIGEFDVVCLANAADAMRLAPCLPLSVVRGQVSVLETAERPVASIADGYVVPARDGLVFGATHDREDVDTDVRAADHARNVDLLAAGRPRLAERLAGQPWRGRASLRSVTPDFLPLAGPVPAADDHPAPSPGLFVLAGLGSRGFCAAPLLAEHVAALALGAPSPLPADLSAIVDPARFVHRRLRQRSGMQRRPDGANMRP